MSTRITEPLGYVERFIGCVPPPAGSTYRVLRQRWDLQQNPPVRYIFRWKLVKL